MSVKTKEKPILFNSDMVRAILDGRKTQTRRVITKKGAEKADEISQTVGIGRQLLNSFNPKIKGKQSGRSFMCPYGEPGTELWVRETFASLCKEGDPYCWCETDQQKQENHFYQYKADRYYEFRGEWKYAKYPGNWDDAPYPPGMDHHPAEADYIPRWKPSIHMPREASRIQLLVTDIRVERLQEITYSGICKEGISFQKQAVFAAVEFEKLWDSINADRGFSWKSNPWVWVVEFEVKEVSDD